MYVLMCPICPAEVDLGPVGEDLSDTRYKLDCPVLRKRLAVQGPDADLECPHIGSAKRVAVLQSRRRV
jgi:hypothetical protein